MTSPKGKTSVERNGGNETFSGLPISKGPKESGVVRRPERNESGTRLRTELTDRLKEEGFPNVLDDEVELQSSEMIGEDASAVEAMALLDEQKNEAMVPHRIIALTDEVGAQVADTMAESFELEREDDAPTLIEPAAARGKLLKLVPQTGRDLLEQVEQRENLGQVMEKVKNDVEQIIPAPAKNRGEMFTLVEPFVVRKTLRKEKLDDRLDQAEWQRVKNSGMQAVRDIIAERNAKKMKPEMGKAVDLINGRYGTVLGGEYGEYVGQWWKSNSPVERVWGQFNTAVRVLPDELFVDDVEKILGRQIVTVRNTRNEYTDHDETVRSMDFTFEDLKKMVSAKLLSEGFQGRIYTEEQLEGIIARKPPSGRPTNS